MFKVFFTIGAIQVAQMAVLLVRTKGLALLLGPEQVGILAVVDKLIAVFAQTASLSLPFAALRYLPSAWASDREQFYTRLRGMSVVVSGLSVAALAAGIALTITWPALWGRQLIPYQTVVLFAFLTIPAQTLVPFLTNVTAAKLSPNRSVLFALAHAAVFGLFGLAGALWLGLEGIYAFYAVPATVLVAVVLVRLNRPGVARVRLPSLVASVRAMPYGIWRFGVAMVGLTFLTPYAALFVHYLVLTDLGAEASGWMQAAIGISLAVRTVLGSAHPVFLTPNVNRGGPPEQRMRWANDYQKTLCLLVGLVLPPLLLFPDIAVRALYSAEFGAAAQVVFLFVLVEIVTLLAGTYQALVLALDRLGYHVAQNVMAQAIMIAVGALAIRPLGIAGAALAALSAQAFLFASTALFLRHTFALRIAPRSALLTAYVVAAVVIAGLIGRTTTGLDLSALALRAATYVGLVAGLTVFLTTADYRRLRELARELSSRALKATRS